MNIRMPGDWGNPVDGGHTVTSAYGIQLASAMYDRLIYLDPTDGTLHPYVAESWDVTPTSVTSHIRSGVTCSDGTPVTPSVIKASFEHFVSPDTASRWVSTTLGSGPFTFTADDAAMTFTVSVEKPFSVLQQGLADARTSIICPAGLAAGADFTTKSYGSGPFVFDSANQGADYTIVKREGWNWGPMGWTSADSGFPDKIVFQVITDNSTAANSLLTGALDVSNISGPDVARLEADSSVDAITREGGAPYDLFMNELTGRPTESETVRKAVATALDPKQWTVAAGEPDAPISTNAQTNPGGYCYTDLSSIMPYKGPDAAKQIMLDGGYTAGADGMLQKDGAPVTLRVVGTDFTGSGVEYMADALQKAGFTVDLVNTDYNTFAQNFASSNWDVIVGLFGGFSKAVPGSVPLFMQGAFPEDGGNNRIRRDDPQLATLVANAFGAGTDAEACAAWEAFNRYIITNSIVIPWATSVTHWFSAPAGTWKYAPISSYMDPLSLRRLK